MDNTRNFELKVGVPENLEWYSGLEATEKDLKLLDQDNQDFVYCQDKRDQVASLKEQVFKMGQESMHNARIYTDPLESLGRGIFMNRSGLKMANIDSLTNLFSQCNNRDLIHFAEICGGPGGFSEYMFYKRGYYAKGYGFTPKNENDYKLKKFIAGPAQTLVTYYGKFNDGDIYSTENIENFGKLVEKDCGKVNVACADGGFSVFGQEANQEVLCRQLYLVQCATILAVLRVGGHGLIKFFDCYTQFSASMMYLMSKCFEKISIVKPYMSRPASSERFLICQNKRGGIEVDSILNHLLAFNRKIGKGDKFRPNFIETRSMFPKEHIDGNFIKYYEKSIESIADIQICALSDIFKVLLDKKDGCMQRNAFFKSDVEMFVRGLRLNERCLKNFYKKRQFAKFNLKCDMQVAECKQTETWKVISTKGNFYKSSDKLYKMVDGRWQIIAGRIFPFTLFFGTYQDGNIKIFKPIYLGGEKYFGGEKANRDMIDTFVNAHCKPC